MFKKVNTPLPQSLPKECAKAAKIFASFVDSGNNGLDGVVPRVILERARGFAIFSVMKAGFVFSARAGSGVVIARLDDGTWSAPSAIGTAGLGVGGQAGAEVTDFLIVLNSKSALRSFMAAGSLTLGGNLSLAVGPIGRNGEAIGSLNSSGKVAAMYSYSKTRGLFGGVSLEGSIIVERQDANATAYRSSDVTVKMLLSGTIPTPEWASPLIQTLERCTGMPGGRKWVYDTPQTPGVETTDPFGALQPPQSQAYTFGGIGSTDSDQRSTGFLSKRKLKKGDSAFPPASWGRGKSTGSYFDEFPPPVDEFGTPGSTSSTHPKSRGISDDFTHRMRNMTLQQGGASQAPTDAIQFATHFDSDYVPEERAKQHPPLASNVQPISAVTASGNLVDIDDKGPTSPFDFDPLGSTHGAPGTNQRMSHTRTSSNPFFTTDEAPPTSSYDGYQLASGHRPSMGSASQYGRGYSPPSALTAVNNKYSNPDYSLGSRSLTSPPPQIALKPELTQPLPSYAVARGIALYDFDAVQPGDLSFKTGQVIMITEKSNTADTWWRGIVEGRSGNFPANFVELA